MIPDPRYTNRAGLGYRGDDTYVWRAADVLPIEVRIDVGGGTYIAENADTGIFGTGSSLVESLRDLRSALRDHLEVLKSEEHLSTQLAEHLEFLRAHLLPG